MNDKKNRILIIEDEVALLYALQSRLSLEGFEVEGYTLGKKGLEALKDKQFNLLILDVVLPDVSGFDILKEIKENSKTKTLPCVILSNLKEKDSMEKGISLGAKDYIPKSEHSLDEIITKIKSFLKD